MVLRFRSDVGSLNGVPLISSRFGQDRRSFYFWVTTKTTVRVWRFPIRTIQFLLLGGKGGFVFLSRCFKTLDFHKSGGEAWLKFLYLNQENKKIAPYLLFSVNQTLLELHSAHVLYSKLVFLLEVIVSVRSCVTRSVWSCGNSTDFFLRLVRFCRESCTSFIFHILEDHLAFP